MGNLDVQSLGIDGRQGLVRPLTGPFDPLFQSAYGVEILVHLALILFSKSAMKPLGVVKHQVEHACLAF